MSTTWWIGVITKSPLEKQTVKNLVKILFDLCDDVGYTKLRTTFSRHSTILYPSDEDFESEFKEPPSVSELTGLIQKYSIKNTVIRFAFTGEKKGEGFDGDVEIENVSDIIDIRFILDDFVLGQPRNVERILDICEAAYSTLNAFYAYLSSENDSEARKGVIHGTKFKIVLKKYEKEGASPFDMKKFRTKVEKQSQIAFKAWKK